METQLVTFELANEHYGVNITAVESTIKLQPITFVPRAPQYVKGVINLRGVVLPVVCLRQRFGLPQSEYTKDTRIIVIEIDGKKVGIVVDAVTEVLSVQNEAIEPPSPLVTS
ncbi:MAG: purine-binding chemotaxis protein CheW, partial [Anaerolineae bacterium]|nr:purine-binding chemotaxis protein CheW [Anaerolineae bacterium]